jgi:hypothetical protein
MTNEEKMDFIAKISQRIMDLDFDRQDAQLYEARRLAKTIHQLATWSDFRLEANRNQIWKDAYKDQPPPYWKRPGE